MPKSFEDLVLKKLDNLLRLLAADVTQGMKQGEQIALLDRVGFPPKEIADLVGTTSNTVSVTLNNLRKRKAGKEGKKKTTRSGKK
jgi:CRP-like cAMP-binding protein